MTPTRILMALFWCVVVAGALLMVYRSQRGERPPALQTQSERAVSLLSDKVEEAPGSVQLKLDLAAAYMQLIRENADSGLYAQVESLLSEAERLEPENAEIDYIRAALLAGRHRFAEALPIARALVEAEPKVPRYRGILSDVEVELGLYEEALATTQAMVDLRPDFSSYSRVSHLRELHGDIDGAAEAMLSAIRAGSGNPENLAWARVELGKLLILQGKREEAALQFLGATQLVPEYPRALQGMARLAFAQGQNEEALALLEEAFDALPIAEHAADLGDLFALQGREADARRLYTAVKAAYRQFEKAGTDVDLEESLFLADRDLDLAEALKKAERGRAERQSVDGDHVLAWALYKNGRIPEARQAIDRALRLGSRAPPLLFHAGMIALAAGDRDAAKRHLQAASDLDPHFSLLHAKTLASTLSSLSSL